MKIILDLGKSIHENAAKYFDEAKKFGSKKKGVEKALSSRVETKKAEKKELVTRKGWFTEFHFFFTSNGFLVVAGKDAKQNDFLGSKHLAVEDLFFHADVVGAPATILKTAGKTPKEQDEVEAAQFAASYSRAWKSKSYSVDVYRVTGENISKHSHGEYVGKGAFMILGERKWFKNTELKLRVGIEKNSLVVLPFVSTKKLEGEVVLVPGSTSKDVLAKQLARKFGVREEELLSIIPGDSEISIA